MALILLISFTFIAIWILTKTLKPTTVSYLVSKQLSTLTSQKIHIEGDVSWQLFPQPGIKISHIYIGNKENITSNSGFIDSLRLNLNAKTLLQGQLVFNELSIDGVTMNLYSNTPAPQKTLDETPNKHPRSNPLKLAIDDLLLTNGKITFHQGLNLITLNGLQMGAHQLNLKNEYFPLQIKAKLNASIADYKIKTSLKYNGQAKIATSSNNKTVALDGQLLLQNTLLNALNIAKITTNVTTQNNDVFFNPLHLSLYQGESIGDLRYNVLSKKLEINQTATNLDAYQLLKDLLGKDLLTGKLDASVHTITLLQNPNGISGTDGTGNISIKDGVLYFVDINQRIDEATQKIHALLAQTNLNVIQLLQPLFFTPSTSEKENTPFKLFSLQYHVTHGQFINDALLLDTDKLQLKGNGQTELNNGALQGRFLATLITNDKALNNIQQLLGGSFPLKLRGTLQHPQLVPDTEVINPIVSKYLLQNTLEQPVTQMKQGIKTLLTVPAYLLPEETE